MIRQPLKVAGLLCLIALLAWPSSVWPQSPAAQPGRPALLEFGAGFCQSCKIMAGIIGELQKSHREQVEFRLVYADQEQELFKRYRIMLIPTQVFLNAEGQEVDRHVGPLTKEQILQKLKNLSLIK